MLENHSTLFLLAALGAALYFSVTAGQAEGQIGLFSWSADVMEQDEGAALFQLMEAQGITELYQYFDDDLEDGAVAQFLAQAREAGVRVYLLTGGAGLAAAVGADQARPADRLTPLPPFLAAKIPARA